MESLIAEAGAFIAAHQFWAGPILGLIVFGESLAVVGLIIPATALMLITGGLIGTGTLDAVMVIAWSVGGAVLGDAVSYVLGRWMGQSVIRRWPLNRHRHAVARARLFFRRFGTASVFLGRFLGPVRSTVPLVAGTMQMSHHRFQTANIASAVVWVPIMLAPGYAAAKGIGNLDRVHDSSWLMLGALVLLATVAGTWFGFRVLKAGPRRRGRKPGRAAAEPAARPT